MLYIRNNCTDPHFNLAAEEYVLTHFQDDVFMLWRNAPSIIIGRYQNTLAEINADYVKEHDIMVVRRMTGGGAVFHDLGNLNFTFVQNGTEGDFRSFTKPILDALCALGVAAEFQGRNDLAIDGQKISGNAQCVHNGRMLHHGTLLFSVMMTNLADALKVNPLKFADKAVKSVRKRVTNISEHLSQPMTIAEFSDYLMDFVVQHGSQGRQYDFTEEDLQAINELKTSKYDTWSWNFGASPRYTFTNEARTTGGHVQVCINVDKGVIAEVKIYGDFFSRKEIGELEKQLQGVTYRRDAIAAALRNVPVEEYICNMTKEELVEMMV
ncbi:MAG: lipoate--protein ligase [Bacteroidales bacterium]|nr:lipoate--protein ligase [Bacteroidales bacterium]